MDLKDRIRELREGRGWSQDDLADRVGVSQVAIHKVETGDTKKPRFLVGLAQVFGMSVEELLSQDPPARSGYNPPPEIFGERDLPVYASVEGGDGAIVVDTTPIDHVVRPWYLKQVREGFAVLVNGASMEPAYEPGDIVIVNPKASLVKGKDIILVAGEEHGEFRASIKRYMGQTSAEWFLKQFNPPDGQTAEFRRFKHEWPRALRVVGKYDGG